MSTSPHDCGGDAAAYVLGALEPAEAQAFARHLETCVVCRDEVAAFERVVDTLPSAAPQYKAPAALRRRVLRDVRHDARRPRMTPARPAGPASPARPVSPAWPVRPAHRSRRSTWGRRPVLAGAGALAAAIVAVVVIALSSGGSPNARVIAATVTGPGAARVRVVGGHAELILTGFPAPPAGKVYEVWLQRGSAPPSPTRTLFTVTGQSAADVGIAGSLHGVSRLMVTPERTGGSQVPTHAAVLVAPLS